MKTKNINFIAQSIYLNGTTKTMQPTKKELLNLVNKADKKTLDRYYDNYCMLGYYCERKFARKTIYFTIDNYYNDNLEIIKSGGNNFKLFCKWFDNKEIISILGDLRL